LKLSDQELKINIKTILDEIYKIRPNSVRGKFLLFSSIVLDNKSFIVNISKYEEVRKNK